MDLNPSSTPGTSYLTDQNPSSTPGTSYLTDLNPSSTPGTSYLTDLTKTHGPATLSRVEPVPFSYKLCIITPCLLLLQVSRPHQTSPMQMLPGSTKEE